jgi:hypothetical protein
MHPPRQTPVITTISGQEVKAAIYPVAATAAALAVVAMEAIQQVSLYKALDWPYGVTCAAPLLMGIRIGAGQHGCGVSGHVVHRRSR